MSKTRTRIGSLLLAALMLFSLLPVSALAAETDGQEDVWFIMQDFGEWGEQYPNYVNVGWQYPDDFDTDGITAIEVGLLDVNGNLIIKYTADTKTIVTSVAYNSEGLNQIKYQDKNGYIDSETRQSSAPFYQSIAIDENGNLMTEVKGEDWTVIPGEPEVFFAWEPATAYVKVTTLKGTQEKENSNFTGDVQSSYVAQVGDKYFSTLDAAFTAASSAADKTVTLVSDVELTAQVTIPTNVTLDGAEHIISIADNVTWNKTDGYQYMLLCNADGCTVKNVTLDAEHNADGCLQFYTAKNGNVENVILKNAQELGLLVNASTVTATGTIELSGNGWGNVINVGWGSNIPEAVTSCSFNASNATLVGVTSIYTDVSDQENAEKVNSSIAISAPDTFAAFTVENGQSGYALAVAQIGETKYASLQDAVNAADTNTATIELLTDMVLSALLPSPMVPISLLMAMEIPSPITLMGAPASRVRSTIPQRGQCRGRAQ